MTKNKKEKSLVEVFSPQRMKRLNVEVEEDELFDLKRRALDEKLTLKRYIRRELKLN